MIIDASVYSGACSCGRTHTMETKLAVVGSGCLRDFNSYMDRYGISGFRCAVYDTNTYHAQGLVRPQADHEAVLDARDLHANEHGVEALRKLIPAETKVLIAVGSGTIHDITRYCAWELGLPFISCPTAASVDGFCSSVAAMTWEGAKKTLTAVPPLLVLADLDVICKAPIRLARSGFGDMIGKYIALTDWKIGHILTGEFHCKRIADMTMEATKAVLDSASGIAQGSEEAFEKLTFGLLLSGLAMQLMGNSRPASGAEHHISHMIEMEPEGLGVHSDALHGEKVGVGTLLASAEYHRLAALKASVWGDYPGISAEEIHVRFGSQLERQIVAENANDAAAGITADRIRQCLPAIRAEIAKIPSVSELESVYKELGIKSSLLDIEVSETLSGRLLDGSPLVRNRLTLMRLRRCLLPMGGKQVILAAHRGEKKYHPENTMPAFEAALAAGVDMIETDIHMTADGELIIMHDRSALRTAGVDRFVTDMTLDEIKALDAGGWMSAEFAGTHVPTVREFMEWIAPTNLLVNWELKDYPGEVGEAFAFESADKLIELIYEYGLEDRSMVNSFSNQVLEHIVSKHGHRFPVHGQGIHICRRTRDEAAIPEEELFDWCCMYPKVKGENPVDYPVNFVHCKEHGIVPCVCIPDVEETYARALALGCKMFTSNDIYEAERILKKLGYR